MQTPLRRLGARGRRRARGVVPVFRGRRVHYRRGHSGLRRHLACRPWTTASSFSQTKSPGSRRGPVDAGAGRLGRAVAQPADLRHGRPMWPPAASACGRTVSLTPCRLAILRSFTVEPVVPLLRAAAFLGGIDLTVKTGEFNAYAQEILDGGERALRVRRPTWWCSRWRRAPSLRSYGKARRAWQARRGAGDRFLPRLDRSLSLPQRRRPGPAQPGTAVRGSRGRAGCPGCRRSGGARARHQRGVAADRRRAPRRVRAGLRQPGGPARPRRLARRAQVAHRAASHPGGETRRARAGVAALPPPAHRPHRQGAGRGSG